MKNKILNSPKRGRKPVFNEEQESKMADRLKEASASFYGVTPKECRKVAYQLVKEENIKQNFNEENKMAGKKWLKLFLNRNKSLSIRKPEATSLNRINGFSH